jgi:very-short-patch-repair endonuclease
MARKRLRKRFNKIDIPLKCEICNNNFKSNAGLSSHLRKKHNITYEDYVLKFYNIDIIKLEQEYINFQCLNKNIRIKKQIESLKKYTSSIKGKSKKEILGDEKYKKFLKSMQGVFTIDWYIKKYGETDGKIKYKERSEKLSKSTYFKKYNMRNKNNWSNISQELFHKIYEIIGDRFKKIYFGELNHEYSCGVKNHNFDFVLLDNKKIIEFNGDKFHANPDIYEKYDIPLKFINKTSEQIWKEDKEKNEKAIKNGFEIKTIWEKEFLKNKEKIILECVEFLLK